MICELNQIFRRLRQYESESDWIAAVLDGACLFAPQAGVFLVQREMAHLRRQRNLNVGEDLTFGVSSARAFATAIESKDAVIALRTPAEVGAALRTPDSSERALLVPVINNQRTAAVLFAGGESEPGACMSALELIAGMASAVLERRANTALTVQLTPPESQSRAAKRAAGAKSAGNREMADRKPDLSSWVRLSAEQRGKHLRARRFSRVKVAEMQLSRPDACRAGREQNNVYLFLKKEIDSARESYRAQFMSEPRIPDYFHRELVRSAADGDESKLGVDYPGRLS